MPEFSLSPFGGEGTAEDAAKLKAAVPAAKKLLIEKFGVDPAVVEREFGAAQKISAGAAEGIEFAAELAAGGRLIPGRIGGFISSFFIGQHRNPDTGKYGLGQPFAYNAAPSPLGYAPPSQFGFQKNWYLPDGVVLHTTEFIDKIGIGLPEQREIDERNERIRYDTQLAQQMRFLARYDSATLEAIAKQPELSTASNIARHIALRNPPDLERRAEAARFVLAQRALAQQQFGQPPAVAAPTLEEVAAATEALAVLIAARRLDALEAARAQKQQVAALASISPILGAVAGGSFHPFLIAAFTASQIAHQMVAKGINKELVTERIDP